MDCYQMGHDMVVKKVASNYYQMGHDRAAKV